MNRLSLAALVALAALPLTALPLHAQTTLPAEALDSYHLGQTYERLYQEVRLSPATCGIVLERPRCRADIHQVMKLRTGDATDTQVDKWFVDGDIALRERNWNDMYVQRDAWKDDPIFAWWWTAGVASIAASLPQGEGVDAYEGSIADVLDAHIAAAPGASPHWKSAGRTPYERLASLQVQLDQLVPVTPYPAVTLGDGSVRFAQLGVYFDTLQQLVDNPFALSRPESRAFGLIVLANLNGYHQQFNDGQSATQMETALAQPLKLDPAWLNTTFREPLSNSINLKWPQAAQSAFFLGNFSAQIAYNAAVLKDAQSDADFRAGALKQMSSTAGFSEKTRADTQTLENLPDVQHGGNWSAINAAATTVVNDIIAEK